MACRREAVCSSRALVAPRRYPTLWASRRFMRPEVQVLRRGLVPTLWWAGRAYASPVARIRPTWCRGADRWFFEPGGRPGPGREGFGAPAGEPVFVRRFLNPLRTRAGVSLFGGLGFSQGRRRSVASGRAGEAELGEGDDHQPRPPGGGFGAANTPAVDRDFDLPGRLLATVRWQVNCGDPRLQLGASAKGYLSAPWPTDYLAGHADGELERCPGADHRSLCTAGIEGRCRSPAGPK